MRARLCSWIRIHLSWAPLSLLLAAPLGATAEYDREGAEAVARLLGYVRYFHPSDQAAQADWNHVAIDGMLAVGLSSPLAEGNPRTPAERARDLEAWIQRVAPTVRVFAATDPAPTLDPALERPPDEASSGPIRRLAWRHLGVALDAKLSQWSSDRIDDRAPPGYGNLAQRLDATPFRGRTVVLRARLRTSGAPESHAQLWLHAARPAGAESSEDSARTGPLRERSWHTQEISLAVAPDALALDLGVLWAGGGSLRIDEVELLANGRKIERGGPQNAGFELGESGLQPTDWVFPYESLRAGYRLLLARDADCVRGACAEIVAGSSATPRLADPTTPFVADLGGGLRAAIPLALWADDRGTRPRSLEAQASEQPSPKRFPAESPSPEVPAERVRRAERLAERLAVVGLAWGAIQHFHATLDDAEVDWLSALGVALDGASVAANELEMLHTLERMAANLGDANAWVLHPDHEPTHQLPLAAEWVQGEIVISEVARDETRIRRGDRVVALGGVAPPALLAEIEPRTPAATVAARRAEALARLFAGRAKERVRLTLERAGAPPFEVDLERTLPFPTVVAQQRLFAEVGPRVFYLDLRRLTDSEFEALLPILAHARGLIFDLRGAPTTSNRIVASLIDRPAQSSSWQIPIALLPDRRGREWLSTFWNVLPRPPRLRANLAILADARAVGYAETLLALAASERWGEIVGSNSGGSNGTINWLDLPGNFRIAWTGMRVLGTDGKPLQGRGIAPTIAVSPTLRGLEEGRDEVLERAIEAVARP